MVINNEIFSMSIVNLLKLQQNQTYKNLKAIVLMDPGDMLKQDNYPLQKSSIPAMVMGSSSFKSDMHGETLLGANNYEVILKPKNDEDTKLFNCNESNEMFVLTCGH